MAMHIVCDSTVAFWYDSEFRRLEGGEWHRGVACDLPEPIPGFEKAVVSGKSGASSFAGYLEGVQIGGDVLIVGLWNLNRRWDIVEELQGLRRIVAERQLRVCRVSLLQAPGWDGEPKYQELETLALEHFDNCIVLGNFGDYYGRLSPGYWVSNPGDRYCMDTDHRCWTRTAAEGLLLASRLALNGGNTWLD